MTRLIAELAQTQSDTAFHITSLNPIRPANAPDAWERKALASFEAGIAEQLEVVDSAGAADPASRRLRYMAPLLVTQSCMPCHEKQGYKIGDVRGGIGVSLPFQPVEAATLPARRQSIATHLVVFLLVSALGGFLLEMLRRRWTNLVETIAALEATRQNLERSNAGGKRGQERLPRQHEPRNPHADERHHRHVLPGPEDRPDPRQRNYLQEDPGRRPAPAGHHQRHPRLVQDRGRQAGGRAHRVRSGRVVRQRHQPVGRERSRARNWNWSSTSTPMCPTSWWATPAPGARCCSTTATTPSSSPNRAKSPSSCAGGKPGTGEVDARIRRARHRHRLDKDERRPPVQQLRAGRQLDYPQVRRHRPGPGDLAAAGRADGRRGRGQHPRGRLDLLVHRAAGSTAPAGQHLACPHARAARAPRSWWWTTTRTRARSLATCCAP
jgi:hypothetical protein